MIDIHRKIHAGSNPGNTQAAAPAALGSRADVLDAEGDAVGSRSSASDVLINELAEEAADILLGVEPCLARFAPATVRQLQDAIRENREAIGLRIQRPASTAGIRESDRRRTGFADNNGG